MLFFLPLVNANAEEYVETNKDTRYITDPIDIVEVDLSDYELLEENDNFAFYFRDDRDIIAVYDKNNGYTWKTGLDIEYSKDIKSECKDAYDDETLTEEERLEVCRPIEDRLNTTFTGIANSLVTLEYFDSTLKVKRISSASYSGGESELVKLSNGQYKLEVNFKEVFVRMDVYITFNELGFSLNIPDDSITGRGVEQIAGVMLNPFMGASGGQSTFWDPVEEKYNIDIPKEMIDGYVLVPDGPGALIRFNDYAESLSEYTGDIYGVDHAQETYNFNFGDFYVPFKQPTMPLYGISHGYRQAAFLGYATEGDEYMEVIVSPEENMTFYTWAYPRFVYNKLYYQVYNQQGAGYFSTFEERNHFDIEMNYEFLSNGTEDGYPADYVGMAKRYKDHLEEEQVLSTVNTEEVPLRVDFIMSDSKEGIFGYTNVYMTNTEEVNAIINDIQEKGIDNLSVGLMGWQKGGVTMQDPYKARFTSRIGWRRDFVDLFEQNSDIDISFYEEYVEITDDQVSMRNNGSKHVNKQYIMTQKAWVIIDKFNYASPVRVVEWMDEQLSKLDKFEMGSFTYDGVGDLLVSDYKYEITVTDAIEMYQAYFDTVTHEVNMTSPNQYLWQYTDRFLQAPMFATSHLIETDTVPFLQLVISDSMEVFTPYANFSFNKQEDILRMIDYNVAPTFLLTEESAHKMASTNSGEFYSTAYENYEDIIERVYFGVSGALNEVIDAEWVDREVIAEGVVVNTYSNGKEIVINYTNEVFSYEGETVQAESYRVYG